MKEKYDIGKVSAAIRDRNRNDIYAYFRDNPGCRQSDAARHLGVNAMTVSNHIRAIRAGWRPSNEEK
jgi:predicted transcriptional regulator